MADIQTCLNNLIAVDHQCTPVTPTSGLYLQDLPFVTIKVADAGVDEETTDGVALMNDRITHAQNAAVAELRGHLAPKIKAASVIANDTVGFFKENLQTVAAEAGFYKGVRFQVKDYSYFELYINSVTIQSAVSAARNVFIIDLMTNRILDTLSVTTVANVPTELVVNQGYTSGKQKMSILVAVDAGTAGSFKNNILAERRGCKGCGSKINAWLDTDAVKIPTGGQLIDSNTQGNTNGTNGVSVNYSLNCIVDPLICNMASQMAWPILHKAGAEIMRSLQYSNRINSIVTVHADDVEALREEFEEQYRAGMDQILDNMDVPNDICFSCRDHVRQVTQIP